MSDNGKLPRFEAVVLVHLDAAYNLARWLTRDPAGAEDAVQDACLRAFRFFDQLQGPSAKAWFMAVVRHACYDWLQKRRAGAGDEPFDETLHTAGAQTVTLEPGWRNHFLAVITDPSLALLLLTVGVYALIFEFSTPGMVVPGILGAVCILVALYGLQMLPINYAGLALISLGLGCMVAEAFLPTFGALGVGGIAAFILGAVMLIDTQTPGFGVPLPLIVSMAFVSLTVILLLSSMAMRARRRPKVAGGDTLIGMTGELLELDPTDPNDPAAGWAQVHGERWRVHCTGRLTRGDRVRVTARHGLTLDVVPAG